MTYVRAPQANGRPPITVVTERPRHARAGIRWGAEGRGRPVLPRRARPEPRRSPRAADDRPGMPHPRPGDPRSPDAHQSGRRPAAHARRRSIPDRRRPAPDDRRGQDRRRAARGPLRRDRATRRRRPGPAPRPGRARSRGRRTARRIGREPGATAAQPFARRAAGIARGRSTWVQMTRAARATGEALSAARTPATSLSAIEPRTRVIGGGSGSSPPWRVGRRSSRARARTAAPAGLWAPSRRTSRNPDAGRRERDLEELEPARPAGGRVPPTPGVVVDRGDPGDRQGVEHGVGDCDVGRLVSAAQPDPRLAQAGQGHRDAVAVPAEERGGGHLGQRHAHPAGPPPDDVERLAHGAGDGQVAALDDRGLLPGDGRDRLAEAIGVVEVDVGDRRHPAVPGMGRVEPTTQPDLDQGHLHRTLGEPAEGHRGEDLELGRLAVSRADPVRRCERLADEPGEGRPGRRAAVDLETLPVAHEVGLGGLGDPQRRRPGGQPRPGRERCPCRSSRRPGHRGASAGDRPARRAAPGSCRAPGGCRSDRVAGGLGAPRRR